MEIFGIFYVHLVFLKWVVKLFAVWYILWPFGIFSTILVCCTKINLAILGRTLPRRHSFWQNEAHNCSDSGVDGESRHCYRKGTHNETLIDILSPLFFPIHGCLQSQRMEYQSIRVFKWQNRCKIAIVFQCLHMWPDEFGINCRSVLESWKNNLYVFLKKIGHYSIIIWNTVCRKQLKQPKGFFLCLVCLW
jgi:hypothetical protein